MNLTTENYYSTESNKAYLSVSQFKDFLECEAMALAKINSEWEFKRNTAMMVGSYVDAYFEGTINLFKAQNPELFKIAGGLKADYVKADQIIKRIENDSVFMEYLQGEKQTIMKADLFGDSWKIKMDAYHPERIVDLKVMRSMEPVMGKSFIEHWNYDVQLSIYSEIERIAVNRKNRLPVYLAVATKEEYTDIEVINIPDWRLCECLDWVEKQMPHILEVKSGIVQPERCGVCDYCKATKILKCPVDFQDVGISAKELKKMRGEY